MALTAFFASHASRAHAQRKRGADTTTAPWGAVVGNRASAETQRNGTVRVDGFDAGELKLTEPPMRVAAV